MSEAVNKQKFIKGTAVSAAGTTLGSSLSAFSEKRSFSFSKEIPVSSAYDIMKDVMKYRKIDAYANAYSSDELAKAQID